MSNKIISVKYHRASGSWVTVPPAKILHHDQTIKVTAMTIRDEVADGEVGFRFFPEGGNSGGQVHLVVEGISTDIDLNWLTGAVAARRSSPTP